MGKWTPGPWFYGIAYEPEDGPQPLSYRGPGYYKNAGVIAPNGTIIVGCDEYDIFGPLEDGEREANVRLIAAAPEMADELLMSANVMDEVCTMLRDRGDSAHAAELAERIRAIRAILAKVI